MFAIHHSEKFLKTPSFSSWKGGLAILNTRVKTEMFFTLSHTAHEIALERCKLESPSFKHSTHCQGTCSNVQSLGTMETLLLLARMTWNFKIELCEETDLNWMDQKTFRSFAKKPLIVRLTPRSRSASS